MSLPPHGLPKDEVLERLAAYRSDDVRWREGRVFSLVYHGGDDVLAVAEQAHRLLACENGLNTGAFPSLRRIQQEVLAVVAEWTEGGEEAAGFLTSGGTESLLMAVKAARERGRVERGITDPNIVLPTSAHAAFEKGCHYFGVEDRRVPVGDDWRADPAAMAAAVDDNTVLLVASAPQYPQGVVDPIEPIAAIAAARDINCHVDACMGGVTLTYLKRLGVAAPRWNFSVPGVTSISVDLHKYGYTGKGASVIIHRDSRLRAHQVFITDNWLGGLYGSPAVLGSKGGGPWAAAWAVMHYLGDDGYLRLTAAARRAAVELADAVSDVPGLRLLAAPDTTLVAFAADRSDRGGEPPVDMFAVGDALSRRDWYVDRQGPPPSLHCTVSAIHDGLIPDFVGELRAAVAEVRATGATGSALPYGTL